MMRAKREAPVILSTVAVVVVTALTLPVLYPQVLQPYMSPLDTYPAALFGLLVLGPSVAVLLTFVEGVSRRAVCLGSLIVTALVWALVAARFGPFIASAPLGRRFFLRLADVEPMLYAGLAASAAFIVSLAVQN